MKGFIEVTTLKSNSLALININHIISVNESIEDNESPSSLMYINGTDAGYLIVREDYMSVLKKIQAAME